MCKYVVERELLFFFFFFFLRVVVALLKILKSSFSSCSRRGSVDYLHVCSADSFVLGQGLWTGCVESTSIGVGVYEEVL